MINLQLCLPVSSVIRESAGVSPLAASRSTADDWMRMQGIKAGDFLSSVRVDLSSLLYACITTSSSTPPPPPPPPTGVNCRCGRVNGTFLPDGARWVRSTHPNFHHGGREDPGISPGLDCPKPLLLTFFFFVIPYHPRHLY